MRENIKSAGFSPPTNRALGSERRTMAAAELIASLGLAISTLVAATVVSIGIARADVATNVIDNESGVFALASTARPVVHRHGRADVPVAAASSA